MSTEQDRAPDSPRAGDHVTERADHGRPAMVATVRQVRLAVLTGPDAGRTWEAGGVGGAVGSHPSNDLVISDPTVSRFHCEIRVDDVGARVRDLDSRNGTLLDGVLVHEAWARSGSILALGRISLRVELGERRNKLVISDATSFGPILGRSAAMRSCFAVFERAAATDATVLLEGETGTGKSRAARAIHDASARRDGPFLVLDCGAVPPTLLESELFGHAKGAFTGAERERPGIFEEAAGGTVFLDEIGELPPELQPKLLRVIEDREVRRLGTNTHRPVDVRLIAATHRELRQEVNAGRFRSDLFYRLAVVRVVVPPLRQRAEDIRPIAENILADFGAAGVAELHTEEFFQSLQRASWPGNVRELRNYLERCLVFEDALSPLDDPREDGDPVVDTDLPLAEARRRAIDRFERAYVDALLQKHDGKVSRAAEAAEVDRTYLYRLMRRHR